jgi:hypothetical protein
MEAAVSSEWKLPARAGGAEQMQSAAKAALLLDDKPRKACHSDEHSEEESVVCLGKKADSSHILARSARCERLGMTNRWVYQQPERRESSAPADIVIGFVFVPFDRR